MSHEAIYRSLTMLYPGEFGREYREDLVALFAAQLADEPPARVWARALRDIALTVPAQHLEVHMTGNRLTIIFGTTTVAALFTALVLGTSPAAVFFVVLALLAAVLTMWARKSALPIEATEPASRGRRHLVLGAGLLAAFLLYVNTPIGRDQDLFPGSWTVSMFVLILAIALLATGAVTSLSAALQRRAARR